MSMIRKMGGWLMLEIPAKSASITKLAANLENAAEQVAGRIANAPESYANHKQITHIIGIERWGQQRLKVALGEPLIEEEYDGYRPAKDTPWPALKETFEATRQQTIELAANLKDCDPSMKIRHNTYGDLSIRAWLKYLDIHANWTSKRLHQATAPSQT